MCLNQSIARNSVYRTAFGIIKKSIISIGFFRKDIAKSVVHIA